MNTESTAIPASLVAKVLAVCGVACFWALPFSPFIEIAAVLKTRRSTGWPRMLAVTGAILCILWTVMAAALLLWLLFLFAVNRGVF
jgi:hypothetical protein